MNQERKPILRQTRDGVWELSSYRPNHEDYGGGCTLTLRVRFDWSKPEGVSRFTLLWENEIGESREVLDSLEFSQRMEQWLHNEGAGRAGSRAFADARFIVPNRASNPEGTHWVFTEGERLKRYWVAVQMLINPAVTL